MEKINLTKLNQEKKLIFKGEPISLPMYKVKAKDLKFNPLNTRIHDIVSTKFDIDLSDEKLYSTEVQIEIFNSLKKTHKDKTNQKLLKSISKEIVEPFVINEYGIVLSGNNRLSLIRANMMENNSPFDENLMLDVLLVKGNLSREEILMWELSLQSETNIQKSYDEMNVVLQIHKQLKEGISSHDLIQVSSYKDESQINKANEIAELYYELLLFARVPRKLDLFRDIKVYSFLDGLNNQLKRQGTSKDEKKILKEIYFKTVLASTMPVQKVRDFLGAIAGKTEIPKEKRVDFMKEFNNEISYALDDTLMINKANQFKSDDIKIIDFAENENNIETILEETTNDIKNKINFLKGLKNNSSFAISKKLTTSTKAIKEINDDSDKTIIFFDDEEIEEIKNLILEHKKEIEKLEEIIIEFESD